MNDIGHVVVRHIDGEIDNSKYFAIRQIKIDHARNIKDAMAQAEAEVRKEASIHARIIQLVLLEQCHPAPHVRDPNDHYRFVLPTGDKCYLFRAYFYRTSGITL